MSPTNCDESFLQITQIYIICGLGMSKLRQNLHALVIKHSFKLTFLL